MKQTITKTVLCLSMILMVISSAARVKAFEKFNDREGFTSVYFSKLMLSLAGSSIADKDTGMDIGSFMKKAKGLQIISAETPKATKELSSFTHNYAKETECETMMQVNDETDKVTFYFKEDKRQSVIIMLCEEKDETAVIILNGTFTQADIAKAMEQAADN